MEKINRAFRIIPADREAFRQFIRHAALCKWYADDEEVLLGVQIKGETEPTEERTPILCRRCRNEITSVEYMAAVNGQHEHTFTNPAGITYHIGCFSDAYGCIVHGVPTQQVTWFPGFSWCFCTCANCLTHLGWFYQSGEAHFFGLILDNLVRDIKIH